MEDPVKSGHRRRDEGEIDMDALKLELKRIPVKYAQGVLAVVCGGGTISR